MRNRRALSTVVGAVFFVIAATSVITYVTYSMNSIESFSNSIIASQTQNVDRDKASIQITSIRIDGGKFNATVVNTGSLPVHLTRLWISNQDLTTPADQKVDLDIRIDPGKTKYNIGNTVSASSSTTYNLKVVTERGNIATYQVSPKASTRIQLISPGTVAPSEDFKVISLITNNSTTPTTIANLVPTLSYTGSAMTLVNGPNPSTIASLPQGSTAAFTWTYTAPSTSGIIGFNGSYVNAPVGSFVLSNTTAQTTEEATAATNSQWSQAASRVGILISGIPNPVSSDTNTAQYGKWGIGIINPLDRNVYVYAVGILVQKIGLISTYTAKEPTTGWSHRDLGTTDGIIWEGGSTPITIPAKSVGQFRVETDLSSTDLQVNPFVIQALTSEGKLSTSYTVTSDNGFPLVNTFYTTNPSNPLANWTYILTNIKSAKNDQVFNATIHNAGSAMTSKVKLIILVPADFTDIKDVSAGTGGWSAATIVTNPDNSHMISVDTSAASLAADDIWTYKFSADTPTVTSDKLYVFQTTSIYPSFTGAGKNELASSLSEAGVEVVP